MKGLHNTVKMLNENVKKYLLIIAYRTIIDGTVEILT